MSEERNYNAEELAAHPISVDPYPPRLPKETAHEQRAALFYTNHPEFWIHPLASSDVSGDVDRATIRVHKAMAAWADAELSASKKEVERLRGLISELDPQKVQPPYDHDNECSYCGAVEGRTHSSTCIWERLKAEALSGSSDSAKT